MEASDTSRLIKRIWVPFIAIYIRIKLKYNQTIKESMRIIGMVIHNKRLRKIAKFLSIYMIILVIFFIIEAILFVTNPSINTLINLLGTIIIYTLILFAFLIVFTYDKIIAEDKSKKLIDEINGIVLSELKNSKFNPKKDVGLIND
jgi:positive regulator of sigma E activity